MTAQQETVWELRCDGCNELLDDVEYGSTVVAESVERIREVGEDRGWSNDGDRDLCASCTCERDGHVRPLSANGGYAFCSRCDETLLETVEPKAEFL